MTGIASSLRHSKAIALASVAALAVATLLLASINSHEVASANSPTIPKPNDVQFQPGNAAKKLVVSWGAAPSIPSGCTYLKTSYQVGNSANNTFEDENDNTEESAQRIAYTSYFVYGDQSGQGTTYNFVAGTTYQARVAVYATCSGGQRSSSTVSVDAVAPYSGPATGFSATSGTTNGSIRLTWTNPTGSGISVTKREYRRKLSSATSWSSWTQAGTSTTFDITGLTPGSNYDVQFRVYTKTGSATGVLTQTLSASSVRAHSVSVGSISNPSATSGSANGEIVLSWSAATSATAYEYQSKKSTDQSWGAWTSAGTSTSKTITGLDQGIIYEFRLRGKASSITGAISASVAAVAQFTPTASARSGSAAETIDVTITAPGVTVTRYELRWKLNSASNYPSTGTGSWTDIGTSTSHTISGLTGSTAYNVQVRVVHSSGDANSTNSLLKTINVTSSAAVKPPTSFSSVAGSQFGSVNLSWNAPAGQTVTRYEYRYRETGGSYPTNNANEAIWTAAGTQTTRSTTTSQTVTGLRTDDTGYEFQLRTVAPGGKSETVPVSAVKPKQLPAPTNFEANPGSAKGSIDLTWTVVSGFTPKQYEYRWKLTSTNTWPSSGTTGDWAAAGTQSTRATADSATVSGLTAGTSYDIELRTVEGATPTNYSAPVSATATSRAIGPPTAFTAAQGSAPGAISISWTDPTGGSITARRYRTKASGQSTVFQGAWQSAGETSPFTITGLAAGANYDVQFGVSVSGGNSIPVTASAISGVVPPPTNVQASKGSSFGEIDLTWNAPNGITVTGYRYRSKKSAAASYPTSWETVSASTTSKTLTGLMGDVEHSIQLSAVFRISGRSSDSYSAPVTVTAVAKPIPPPTNLDAEETTVPGVVLLQWVPPGSVETHGFQFRYKPQAQIEGTWSPWVGVNGEQTSTQVRGLEVGIGYQFELTAQNGPLGTSPSVAFAMEPSPAEPPTGLVAAGGVRMITLAWDTPEAGASTGYRYRYRQSAGATGSWSEWFSVRLTDSEAQSTLIYGLEQATEYAVELTTQRGNTFSESVSATAMTNLDVPLVARISPTTPAVSVKSDARVALEVNVFDTQGGPANEAADGKTGMFDGVNTRYEWAASGAGSFNTPDDGRRVVYIAPSTPGTYAVTVSIGPRGICTSHYAAVQETDPCAARFTVQVSADRSSNGQVASYTNPPGPIPTSLRDADGMTYSVFTPEQGGSHRLDGATVTAFAGAVADNTIIGVRIESTDVDRPDPNGNLDLGETSYRVIAINAQSEPLTTFRFNNPIPICLPIPNQFGTRLSDVSLAQMRSDGSVLPIGQRVAASTSGTVVCSTVAQLPSTFVVAARKPAETAPSDSQVSADTNDAIDALLPDAGGYAPHAALPLLGFVLLIFSGILFIASVRLNRNRAHRGSHR